MGMVSTEWPYAKWTGYEHLLVIKGTNNKQVHHLKKESILSASRFAIQLFESNLHISNVKRGRNETKEKVFCREMLSSKDLHEPKNALGSDKERFAVDNLKEIYVP